MAPRAILLGKAYALLVRVGKHVCKPKPNCPPCPTRETVWRNLAAGLETLQ